MEPELAELLAQLDLELQGEAHAGGAPPAGAAPAPASLPADTAAGGAPPACASLPADAAFGAAPAAQREPPAPWEHCRDCGVPTQPAGLGESVCPDCSRLFERPEEAPRPSDALHRSDRRPAPPFRMVGGGAAKMQPQLDQAYSSNSHEVCMSDLKRELINYNREHVANNEKAFPVDVLNRVAEDFVEKVRPRAGVLRARNKQMILALLVYHRCLAAGAARSREETTRLLQLTRRGFARGETQLRSFGACIDTLNADHSQHQVDSILARLGLTYDPHELPECSLQSTGRQRYSAADAALFERFRQAAYALLAAGRAARLGIECEPKTRAAAAVYEVLRRAQQSGLIPPHWALADGRPAVTLEWLTTSCEIRPQTVRRAGGYFYSHHKKFRRVYEEHALCAQRLPWG